MKKGLYAINDFPTLIRDGGYYVDKTRFIEELEELGSRFLTFLRPRRFGKSLFLSMLEAYYDINTADEFDELFAGLYIGKNPTKLRNSYPILKLDFSRIRGNVSLENIENAFNLNIMSSIETFYVAYPEQTGGIAVFDKDIKHLKKADMMLDRFLYKMEQVKLGFYLLIDEYDNFANNILAVHGKESYYNLTHGTGFLRSFFATIKAGTSSNTIARMFVTGVSPLVMSDVTSGFNIDENISQINKFNEMVGFTQQETEDAVDYYIAHKLIPTEERDRILEIMKDYYDGYLFAPNAQKSVYNSTTVLYLLNQYIMAGELPLELIDKHIRTDYEKLKFLVVESKKLNGNFDLLNEVLQTNRIKSKLVRTFAMTDLIEREKFISFLYYLGLLTVKLDEYNEHVFSVPNESCREILWGYIRYALEASLGHSVKVDFNLYSDFKVKGAWRPMFEAIFSQLYKDSSNRDFIQKEAFIKGYLMASLTSLEDVYVFTEREFNKGYVDIFIEADLERVPSLCKNRYLIEIKYIKKTDITETNKVKLIADAKQAAELQLSQYAQDTYLEGKPVVRIVVIATGDELLLLEGNGD